MATVSIPYTISAGAGVIVKYTDYDGQHEFQGGRSGRDPHRNVLVRMIQDEFAQNGTTSGNVVITAT